MIKILSYILFLVLSNNSFSASGVMIDEVNLVECKNHWKKVVGEVGSASVDKLLERWLADEKVCTSNSYYQLKLGWLYLHQGDYDRAKNAFKSGLKLNTNYKRKLMSGLADIYFHKATRDGEQELYVKARKSYQKIVNLYPDWYGGYEQLAVLEMIEGDYQSSVNYGEKALSIEPSLLTYRTLAISYKYIESYQASIKSMSSAYEIDPSILADKDMMLPVVMSYIRLKEFEPARNFLVLLMKAHEGIENSDEDFIHVASVLKEELKANNISSLP